MKKVYFATGNKGKYGTLKDILKHYSIKLVHKPVDFSEELDSESLEDIACDKVMRAYKDIKKPVISLDAGFYIQSLNSRPGAKINPFLTSGWDNLSESILVTNSSGTKRPLFI